MAASMRSWAGVATMSAVIIMLAATAASAQVPAPTPAQSAFLGISFATVTNGRDVWITMSDGSRLKARVTAVAPTGLVVTEANGQGQTVRFEGISRIQRVSHRLRTGTLVGLGVGAGLGALGAAVCDGEAGCAPAIFFTYAAFGAGIGALSGAIRNAANRDEDIVYDAANRTTTTVALTPIVSRTRKGAALSITWR